jgi:geranylgeranyl pyrophosphate synthase
MERKLSSNLDEELTEELLRFFEFYGKQALEITRKSVLEEIDGIKSEKVREALQYFIANYWHDLARPTLLSVCCEAVGGDPNTVIPFAVALSILSGGIDIHDDAIDESKKKYEKVTVYGKYGKDIAILVGDALLFKGFALLQSSCINKISKEKAKKIMRIVKGLFYELGDAEALELELRGCENIKPEEYLQIIKRKAADVEAHARIGAILGNASSAEEENLAKYGRLLGMIIIIKDDIADLMDRQELNHRIRKEHLPLPLAYVLRGKEKVLSQVSIEELLEKFGEKIEKEIEQTRKLLKKLSNEAYSYIKDFKAKEKLEKILMAFSNI